MRTVPLDERARARRRERRRRHPGHASTPPPSRSIEPRIGRGCRSSYPAVEVTGSTGAGRRCRTTAPWSSQAASTQGQTYEVVHEPAPADARADPRRSGRTARSRATSTTALPDGHRRRSSASSPPRSPPARRTTTTRSSRCSAGSAAASFNYSLDAPVEDGFDGSGAEAVAQFLEVREGYCVHFASAFALMARTLGHAEPHRRRLPSGHRDRRRRRRARPVYSVSSSAAARVARGVSSRASAGCRSSRPPDSACRRRSRPPDRRPGGPDDPAARPRARLPAPTEHRPLDPNDRSGPRDDQASGRRDRQRVNPLPALGDHARHPARCSRSPRLAARACAAVSSPPPPAAATPRPRGRWCRMPRSTSASPVPGEREPRGRSRSAWSTSTARRADAMTTARQAIERASYAPRRASTTSGMGDAMRGCRDRRARGAAAPRPPPARRLLAIARPALADRPPGQRLRRWRSRRSAHAR